MLDIIWLDIVLKPRIIISVVIVALDIVSSLEGASLGIDDWTFSATPLLSPY